MLNQRGRCEGFATLALSGYSPVETFYELKGDSDGTGSWLADPLAQAAPDNQQNER
jgi:hypothetical protein